jgi:WD40 repeat protein
MRHRLAVILILASCYPALAEVPEGESTVRKDLYGDPLPAGAMARLGTVRFRHGDSIRGVAFSPDGKMLASVSSDGIRLWEAVTGQQMRLLGGQMVGASAIAFSPDGTMLATGSYDRVVRLWDIMGGKEIRQMHGHQDGIHSIRFSPDGKSLASAGGDGVVRLWDVASGKELPSFVGHEDQINPRPTNIRQVLCVAFSPDGKVLASACLQDKRILLWEVSTGQVRSLPDQDRAVAVAFSPDGKTLASAGHDRIVRLWDVATGQETRRYGGHQGEVHCLAFSPDGNVLALGGKGFPLGVKGGESTGSTLHLWELTTGRETHLPGPFEVTLDVVFSPDGKKLAAVGGSTAVHLVDVASGKELQPQGGHDLGVLCMALSPDGKTLVTGGMDNMIHFWDPATGRELRRLMRHTGYNYVSGLTFTADGKTVVSGSYDGVIRIWDPVNGEERRQIAKLNGGVFSMALSPDGKTLATLCLDGGEMRDLETGKVVGRMAHQGKTLDRLIMFSPDGRSLVTIRWDDNLVRLWDAVTGKLQRSFAAHQAMSDTGPPNISIAFSPDSKSVATGGTDNLILLWDAATGKQLRRFVGHANPISGVAFSSDGKTLVSASGNVSDHKDTSVRMWEVATAKERWRFTGHQGPIICLAICPDGRQAFSGSHDATALAWDLTAGMQERLGKSTRLTPGKCEALWTALADEDAAKACGAIWTLIAAPQSAVPFLERRLRPTAPPDVEQISRWIADLESERFSVREQATRALEELADLAAAALKKKLAQLSPEGRRRGEQFLEKLTGPIPPGERLQALRAIEVLEHISTPEAKQILQTLATGTPEARLTQEARASLERLAKRPVDGANLPPTRP